MTRIIWQWKYRSAWAVGLLGALGAVALGQSGDKAGELQKDVVRPDLIPPAPLLSPADQMKTFTLPTGFQAELVAAEPLVNSPVQIQFDHLGRLWVVEMTAYMPNAEGRGEREPRGAVAVLTDTNGDGRMDQRTVFAGELVMPRSLMVYGDGAVVAVPPKLIWFRDTDGDGKADQQTVLASDFATEDDATKHGERANPEHSSNSPTWALDNWIYAANHRSRYRVQADGTWKAEPTIFRGQWGLSQDDQGRLVFNSNSDWLRGDFIPSHYLARNPYLKGGTGADVQLIADQRVWPGRVNPGVNRGYQPGTLNPDGRLAKCTAACGPVVYRGAQFPADFRGDVFVCEPSANLIRRFKLTEIDGVISARNAYDEAEFLTSTDERFRPVNLANGPDGALYVVDLARGLIQHRIYLTSYLRKQLESRDLIQPVQQGRIYRIVHAGRAPERTAMAARPSTAALVARLSDPNGFWRDRAQQILVQRKDTEAVEPLRALLRDTAGSARGRLHALWTLEGLDAMDLPGVEVALQDSDTLVRKAGLRLLEPFFAGDQRDAAVQLLFRRIGWFQGAEQIQLLLTLGQLQSPQGDAAMKSILISGAPSRLRFDAAISGLRGRELEFLEQFVNDPVCTPEKSDHTQLVSGLARAIALDARAPRLEGLLNVAGRRKAGEWQQLAILEGVVSTVPAPPKDKQSASPVIKPVRFAAEPAGWATLQKVEHEGVQSRLARLAPLLAWPGHNDAALPKAVPFTAAQQESYNRGRDMYAAVCGACHQPHGDGQEGLAPPLRDSEWALGSEQRLVRIVLHGARDAFTVKGQKWELAMPAFGEALDDQQIADALTYIRREWGHVASPVAANTVSAIRAATLQREDSWTEGELLRVP